MNKGLTDSFIAPHRTPSSLLVGTILGTVEWVWGRKTTTPGVNANEYGCVNFFRILNFSLLVGYWDPNSQPTHIEKGHKPQ